jgi:hypothetical protein
MVQRLVDRTRGRSEHVARKALVVASLVFVVATMGMGGRSASADTAEGCLATVNNPCSYVATQAGGFVAAGHHWTVTIFRGDKTIQYTDEFSVTRADVIRPGDRVRAIAGEPKYSCYLAAIGYAGLVRVGPTLAEG